MKELLKTALLIAAFCIGAIGVLSVPADNSETWLFDFVLAKAIGVISFFAWYKLLKYWGAKV